MTTPTSAAPQPRRSTPTTAATDHRPDQPDERPTLDLARCLRRPGSDDGGIDLARIEPTRVVAWTDTVVDRLGHDPRSAYVERFWLSVLGPSTTWLVRRLAAGLDEEPEGYDIDLAVVARALGLSPRGGRNSAFLRALRRTCDFGLARLEGPDALAVRRRVPPLNRGQIRRLPTSMREEHRAWQEPAPEAIDPAEIRRRARRLALSLVELGEDLESTERQLHRWRFHPALAHESATWAWEHHRRAHLHEDLRPLGRDTASDEPPPAGDDAA